MGILQAEAETKPVVQTYVSGGTITAGGSISLAAGHNTGPTARTTSANSAATSGGLFTFSGIDPKATSAATVDTYVGTGAKLVAGGNVDVDAQAKNLASASSNGLSIGAVAIGSMSATAVSGGTTLSHECICRSQCQRCPDT